MPQDEQVTSLAKYFSDRAIEGEVRIAYEFIASLSPDGLNLFFKELKSLMKGSIVRFHEDNQAREIVYVFRQENSLNA